MILQFWVIFHNVRNLKMFITW